MKVLIVDDDSVSLKKLEVILSDYGECTLAPSGSEALLTFDAAYTSKQPFQLVTLDMQMPCMSGEEVLRRIREFESAHLGSDAERRTKIIMVTVVSDSKRAVAAFGAGCQNYVLKPVTPKRLEIAMSGLGFAKRDGAPARTP